jgi:hypothetical protein
MRNAEPALVHNLSLRLITPSSWCWKIHSAFPSCITRFDAFERVASRTRFFFVRRPNESSCLPCFMRAVIKCVARPCITAHAQDHRGKRSSGAGIGQGSELPDGATKVCDPFACDLGKSRGARLGAGRRQSVLGGSLAPIIIKMIRYGNTN